MTLASTLAPAESQRLVRWLLDLCLANRDWCGGALALADLAEREALTLLQCADEELPPEWAGAPSAFVALWAHDEAALEALVGNVVRYVRYGVRPTAWTAPAPDTESVPDGLAVALRRLRGVETCDEARERLASEDAERLAAARTRAEERRRARPREATR
ncbi:MAG: hypothetical protein QME96_06245, partial [Myxococcota bacterium]|nr:hypothetical protein [Myxococcota bacterium]